MSQDEFFQKRIQDLADMAYQRDIVTFSGFLNMNELHMVNSLNLNRAGIQVHTWGGYDMAERQMAAFHSDALSYNWEFPISCVKIQPKAVKYAEALTHRDYLGALLNLGVERSTIGDIRIRESCAYVFCSSHMESFIIENLCRIRHTTVLTEPVTSQDELPAVQFVPVSGTVASVRLDNLIALAFGVSRSSISGLITKGCVFVNGKLVTSNGYHLKEEDVISVRKMGKFRYERVTHQTKKGRYSVLLQRYA